MIPSEFVEEALSLPGVAEHAHFDRRAFKIEGKRIFATLHEASRTVNLKLSEVDQSIFAAYEGKTIYAVRNKWGLRGWTTFELEQTPKELIRDAVNTAYQEALKTKGKKK